MAHNIHLDQAWGDDLYIRDHIDAVLFFGGAVAVYKRKARDVAPALMFADRHLKSVDKTPEQLLRLVDYILRHDGRLDHAERVVREAANLAGPGIETHRLLVDILCRQARLGDAAQAAAEATRLWPEEHGTWFRLSLVEVRLGRTGQAIAALERAVSIQPDEAHYHDLLSHLWETQGEPRRALLAAKAAASVHPNYEPRQQRIAMLEQLAATAAGPR
jgi:tetratricopeptide (TPR) repeat protein